MKSGLLIIFLSVIFLFQGCKKQNETINDKPVSVKVYKLKPESISNYIYLTGAVKAVKDAVVYSKISEKLDKIIVQTGQKVKQNEVLAIQSNEILKQGVQVAEAMLQNAKAQLNMIKIDYERMQRLYKEKAISQQQFDKMKTQKQTAESTVEQSIAQLKQVKEQYENSFIKAPFGGIVAAILFDENQMVPAGQPVIQIISTKGLKANLKVASQDIPKIKKGQRVIINFPSFPDKQFEGYVYNLDEAVDPLSKTLEVEVGMKKNNPGVKSGMFAQFLIEIHKSNNTIIVPDDALLTQTEVHLNKDTGLQESVRKYFIFKIKNNIANLKEVKTGINSEGKIEITSGLSFGDSVVVVGQNIVKDEQKVQVID